MKTKIITICLVLMSLSAFAQIDSKNNSFAIPAEEVEDPKADNALEIKAEKESLDVKPDDTNNLETTLPNPQDYRPKKNEPFSIVQQDNYKNPAELHTDKLNRQLEFQKEERQLYRLLRRDMDFGTIRTSNPKAKLLLRDFGAQDGDYIRVFLNGDIVYNAIELKNRGTEIEFTLIDGENKIVFQALNQGASGPNTAEFLVFDESGKVTFNNNWNLATGFKAKLSFLKENDTMAKIKEQK